MCDQCYGKAQQDRDSNKRKSITKKSTKKITNIDRAIEFTKNAIGDSEDETNNMELYYALKSLQEHARMDLLRKTVKILKSKTTPKLLNKLRKKTK